MLEVLKAFTFIFVLVWSIIPMIMGILDAIDKEDECKYFNTWLKRLFPAYALGVVIWKKGTKELY